MEIVAKRMTQFSKVLYAKSCLTAMYLSVVT